MANTFAPAFSVTVNGSRLAADLSAQIKDLTVTNEINTVDQFSFTLVNQYPAMRWTHSDDRDLFRIGGTVAIEMGYVNEMQKTMEGEILTLKPSFPDSGGPTLGVEGQSVFNRLQRNKEPFSFNGTDTDKEIVEKVVEKAKLKVNAEDTGKGKVKVDEKEITAWDLILKRAKENDFDVVVDGKTLLFGKSKEESQATLEYGKSLKSFKATLDLKNQVSKVVVFTSIFDALGKVIKGAFSGDGEKTAAQLADEWLGEQAVHVSYEPALSQKEADEKAKAIYNLKLAKACTGEATSIGLANLRAGRYVDLQGIGVFFSGIYKITKSVHKLDVNGYLTTLTVERRRF